MKLSILIIPVFFTSILFAQENASMVLEKYYEAIGGQEHLSKIESIYTFADCSSPHGAYQTEVFSAKGSKTFFRQIHENTLDYIGVANGETYWTKGKDVAIANKTSASMWRSHEIHWIATHLRERFHRPKFEGIAEFSGKAAVKLSAIDDVDKTAFLYFDNDTHLFRGFTILNPFAENPEPIDMVIHTWEKINNILYPKNVVFKDKNGEYNFNFRTIQINQPDTGVFDIPEKIMAIQKLLALHELQRKAHFSGDADLLVSMISDDYTEISNGTISSPKKEELLKRFRTYFDAVTFIEWDDITPPVIKLSDDATLAHVYVHKRVRLKTKEQREELATFAWTSTFQFINDTWLMTSITSTVEK